MGDISWSVVVTIIVSLLSAGVSWGVITAKLSSNAEVVKDLKQAVADLKGLATKIEVAEVLSTILKQTVDDQGKRISALELEIAKLQAKQ